MVYRDNRTRDVFRFLCQYREEYGFVPTIRKIADHEGFSSNSGVIRHLDKLEQWGWIERHHGQARSIRLVHDCKDINEPKVKSLLPTRQFFRRR